MNFSGARSLTHTVFEAERDRRAREFAGVERRAELSYGLTGSAV
jgi:hypothetical protein